MNIDISCNDKDNGKHDRNKDVISQGSCKFVLRVFSENATGN